jgi:adenylate kinase family enzyme
MKYFLGGFNGCGKTTLVKNIHAAFPSFQVMRGSMALMDAFGIPGDYEALRNISQKEKIAKLGSFLKPIFESPGNFILDSHYVNIIRGNLEKNTGDWIGNFDALLFISVSPETVLKRIQKDQHHRDRDLFPPHTKEKDYLEILRMYIHEYEEYFQRLVSGYRFEHKVLNGDVSEQNVFKEFLFYHSQFKGL